MVAPEWSIGHTVSGVTATGEAFEGELFTYDMGTGCAVIRTEGDIANTHDVTMVNTAGCTNLRSTPPSGAVSYAALPVVDAKRSKRRLEANVKAAAASAANIGVGVTREAQDIFDALARTLPCQWEGTVIKVMDEVTIAPPYAACAGVPGGDLRAVERVQKVLAHEKSKLGLK
ncbi:anticodon-binding domain-containing protein [bacterium]|jgi:hypothetical protein|nr:anticodon-binding domain-containing protein [bacterium]|tara:strand:- start:20982 stop:21500 length:519 start_codon:yes stop_codon:yes gene_type:complete